MLAASVRRTSVGTIVGMDLLPIDYHHGPAWPTTLFYNPAAVAVNVTVPLPLAVCASEPCTLYDAAAQTLIGSAAAGQTAANVTLGADAAAVIVIYSSAAPLVFDSVHKWLMAGGAVIDWAAVGLPQARVK
jgi:hypothetical protein